MIRPFTQIVSIYQAIFCNIINKKMSICSNFIISGLTILRFNIFKLVFTLLVFSKLFYPIKAQGSVISHKPALVALVATRVYNCYVWFTFIKWYNGNSDAFIIDGIDEGFWHIDASAFFWNWSRKLSDITEIIYDQKKLFNKSDSLFLLCYD